LTRRRPGQDQPHGTFITLAAWSWAIVAILTALSQATVARAQQPAPATPPQPSLRSTIPDGTAPKGAVTTLPKAAAPATAVVPLPAGQGQIALVAMLTEDGQRIESGLVWRLFLEKGGPDGRHKFVTESRIATTVLRLPAGDYLVSAAFGRAQMTRRLQLKAGDSLSERFVLNAGGLKLTALVENGQPAAPGTVTFDVFSDERDQYGNRSKVLTGAKAGVIVRLNSGIYNVVSTYGDANAILRTDVSVEAGKLTEATVAHAVGKVTLKLVLRAGGEALTDIQWSITTPLGDVVKESVGALPTHVLAPGTYVVSARAQGRVFRREFTVQHNDAVQVEVLVQ
jgi:hypothetical protein